LAGTLWRRHQAHTKVESRREDRRAGPQSIELGEDLSLTARFLDAARMARSVPPRLREVRREPGGPRRGRFFLCSAALLDSPCDYSSVQRSAAAPVFRVRVPESHGEPWCAAFKRDLATMRPTTHFNRFSSSTNAAPDVSSRRVIARSSSASGPRRPFRRLFAVGAELISAGILKRASDEAQWSQVLRRRRGAGRSRRTPLRPRRLRIPGRRSGGSSTGDARKAPPRPRADRVVSRDDDQSFLRSTM